MSWLTKVCQRHQWAILAIFGLLVLAGTAGPAMAAEGEEAPGIVFKPIWLIAPIGAICALIMAAKFYKDVKNANPGDEKMQEIAKHVTDGALAYLKRQYLVVAVFFLVVMAALAYMAYGLGVQHGIVPFAFLTGGFFSGLCGWLGMKTATLASNRTAQGAKEGLNRGLTVAFRAGAVMGLVVVGFGLLDISIWYIILSNFPGLFGIENGLDGLVEITVVMLTFGMGASSQALFARVGGGIYTKAADVGADLVGKVEAGIPEDDPRNPATIADNVGDNVGDVAGMGADLYESYCGSILATAALGVAAAAFMPFEDLGIQMDAAVRLLIAPMVLAGVGIFLSIAGIFMVRTKEGASMKQLMGALGRGVNGSSILIVAAAAGVCYLVLGGIPGVDWLGIWFAIIVGLAAGMIIGKSTEYYTSYDYRPTREVSKSSETGHATVIISGIAEGMKSTWASILTVIVAILAAYSLAGGFENAPLGLYGVGIAAVAMLSTLGITLATDAYGPIADNAGGNAEMTGQDPEVRERTDALDSLGNTTAAIGKGFAIGSAALTALALLAAYVEEVRVGQQREARDAYSVVDSEWKTAADAGVGELVYLGSGKVAFKPVAETGKFAVKAGMVMDHRGQVNAFDEGKIDNVEIRDIGKRLGGEYEGHYEVVFKDTMVETLDEQGQPTQESLSVRVVAAKYATLNEYMDYYGVTLMNPKVLGGLFSGVMLVFLFSAMTMKAVGRAANSMVKEVRRQFKEIPGIMEGTGTPDYARCVAISTAGAQKEMVVPSMMALVVPVAVGLLLDVPGVLGLLAGGLTCGFAVAIFMANAGGAWDNAKKYIETGELGGKGSDNHKATVTGDTVGDPFKDTSGPSLNILIKLMSMVSVVFAGLIVKYAPMISNWLGMN